MVSEWSYIGRQCYERSCCKWILLFFSILFAVAVVLPKEQYKIIGAAYKKQEVWIVNCQISQEAVEEIEGWKDIETVYPLCKLQASLKSGEEKKDFDLYGISRNYDSDIAEDTIFLPEKWGLLKSGAVGQAVFSVGKGTYMQKDYMFSHVRKSKKNAAYISGDMAERIIRETGEMAGSYDGICIRISSAETLPKIEKLVKKIQGESLNDMNAVKKSYREGSAALGMLVFYAAAGILVMEALIGLIMENLWYGLAGRSDNERFTEDFRRKVKRYWFLKMNSIFLFCAGTAVLFLITGVI